jgi:alpha-N-arabinofuranosidase
MFGTISGTNFRTKSGTTSGIKLARVLLALSFCFAPVLASAQQPPNPATPAILAVQVQKPIAKVSPTLYGLMTEEINYSYDGGLYAELVRNRSVMDDWNPAYWTLVQNKAIGTSMEFEQKLGPGALTKSLKLVVAKASPTDRAGIENQGFWGIPLRARTT